MEICVFSSGSGGNCTFVSSKNTSILIDVGISGKEICNDLKLVGKKIEDLSAILITHPHTDHFCFLNTLERKYNIPLYATEYTASSIDYHFKDYLDKYSFSFDWGYITDMTQFEVGDLLITPFNVPHDANGAVAFRISDGKTRIAVATDLGYITDKAIYYLSCCDALVLEMNHDVAMLKASERPETTKTRILSNLGHLSNDQAAEFLDGLDGKTLKYLFPAHISSECNDYGIITHTLNEVNRYNSFKIVETHQNQPSKVIYV